MDKIKIGVIGYGNVGRGAVKAVLQNEDMELVGVFTRREPDALGIEKAYGLNTIPEFEGKIDVMILCGGSKSDLDSQTLFVNRYFNTVDSFDTHARIPEYFKKVDENAREFGRLSMISTGWDPGLFSLFRVLSESVMPVGNTHTFWGKGVSQGHSDAIRHIEGVRYAIQYTIPDENVLSRVRNGENVELSLREKIKRECFVVADESANCDDICRNICSMPYYFDEYDTVVHFIDEATFLKEHSGMPHGGNVVRISNDPDIAQLMEFRLALGSNPEFTAGVLAAYARAVAKLNREGKNGAVTVFDIPISYMAFKNRDELLATML